MVGELSEKGAGKINGSAKEKDAGISATEASKLMRQLK